MREPGQKINKDICPPLYIVISLSGKFFALIKKNYDLFILLHNMCKMYLSNKTKRLKKYFNSCQFWNMGAAFAYHTLDRI